MNSRSSFLIITWLILVAHGRSASAKDPPKLNERIEKIVGRHVQDGGPGFAVLVVHEGKIVHRHGYGLANTEKGTAITPRTAFDLASCSKQFTAMAIMILAERGQLKYNGQVADLLPMYKVPVKGRPVLVQDLLWHISGLADYTGDEWKGTDKEFRDLTTAAHVKWLNGTKPRRPPGVKYEYNNSGYALLAQIVQHVSHKSYAEFLQNAIFDPLEMKETVVVDDLTTKVPQLATGYTVTKKGEVKRSFSPSVINGDGNIFSTIDDLAKWDHALRSQKLVKEATLKRAFTPGKLDNDKPVDYGFGWEIERYWNNLLWVGHSGAWAGTATYISRYVDQDITVVLLSNDENADVSGMAEKISSMFDE